MDTSSNPSASPNTLRHSLFPPEPAHNPSIAPPFSKRSFESMASTLHPTPSEQQDHPFHSNTPTTTTTTTHASSNPHDPTDYTSTHPFSAFYSHPTTRTSLDQAKSASKLNVNVYEHDLENNSRLTTNTNTTTAAQHGRADELDHADGGDGEYSPTSSPNSKRQKRISTMWPSIPRCAAQLRKSEKRQSRHNITGTVRGSRACAPYRRLSRGQKWVVQILLAMVVVGAATALGVGISRAVG